MPLDTVGLLRWQHSTLYRLRRNNADADALSRLPTKTSESAQVICNSVIPKCYVEIISFISVVILDSEDQIGLETGCIIDLVKVQKQDPDIRTIVEHLKSKSKQLSNQIGTDSFRKQLNHLRLIDGVWYRSTITEDQNMNQIVLPTVHVPTVLETLHDDYGHPGKNRTTSLVRERFYWPGMHQDKGKWINECGRCVRRK